MSYFPEIAADSLRFIIAKISNSRKELEIRLVSDKTSQYENMSFNLSQNTNISLADFYLKLDVQLTSIISSDVQDIVIPTGAGKYIPVVNSNYYVDAQNTDLKDIKKYLFVIKLNKPLPPVFKKLRNYRNLVNH